jgi:ABC-type oligopeptide transport system substrate-binding subunit
MQRRTFLAATAGLLTAPWALRAQTVPQGGYGVGAIGLPALPADFQNFPYVNPKAPKGGSVTLSEIGGFDSFNPFIIRGTPVGHAAQALVRRGGRGLWLGRGNGSRRARPWQRDLHPPR